MYPLVGGQRYYGWMNISQTLLIRKWGAETSTPTTVRRGPSHHGLSTETAWRAQTLPPPSRNRARDLNREPEMEIAKRWEPCSHRRDKRSEPAPKQIKTQTRGKDGKLSMFSWGEQAFSQNDIPARNFKNNIDRSAYREKKISIYKEKAIINKVKRWETRRRTLRSK